MEIEVRRLGYAEARVAVTAHPERPPWSCTSTARSPGPQIWVTTARATESGTPVAAFTELDRKEVRDGYWGEDVRSPARLPGTYATRKCRAGIGL